MLARNMLCCSYLRKKVVFPLLEVTETDFAAAAQEFQTPPGPCRQGGLFYPFVESPCSCKGSSATIKHSSLQTHAYKQTHPMHAKMKGQTSPSICFLPSNAKYNAAVSSACAVHPPESTQGLENDRHDAHDCKLAGVGETCSRC